MGASESVEITKEDEQEREEYAKDFHDQGNHETIKLLEKDGYNSMTNALEQDPEMSLSISSLSPQLSSLNTPRFDSSIKDSNPHLISNINRTFSLDMIDDDRTFEIYVICHGECHMNLKPDLVAGRCPEAALTPNGKRQSRALAVFLKSQGIRFNAIYTSPLDRARATAIPVCQEMNFPENKIQTADALNDMSQGSWEGCRHSDVYTPSILSVMERLQPDFCAPCGETLRQVEFRMMEFLNGIVSCLPEKLKFDYLPPDESPPLLPKLDIPVRPKIGPSKRKPSKSRLQMVHASGDHEADDEMSPRVPNKHREHKVFPELSLKNVNNDSNYNNDNNNCCLPTSSSCCCIGVFSHSVPIRCLVTSILGCSPTMSTKICIQDSSVTVFQYSRKMGWQIKRVNDTCHLRLM
uniref:uncharacterized protein LOC122609688 n=1 Tax=Erigeron canadensis TaxID=72917 RepID=UPI001CB8A94B|nr:uncharacterized protein LOC122609688 [Erigeron canadensis]